MTIHTVVGNIGQEYIEGVFKERCDGDIIIQDLILAPEREKDFLLPNTPMTLSTTQMDLFDEFFNATKTNWKDTYILHIPHHPHVQPQPPDRSSRCILATDEPQFEGEDRATDPMALCREMTYYMERDIMIWPILTQHSKVHYLIRV